MVVEAPPPFAGGGEQNASEDTPLLGDGGKTGAVESKAPTGTASGIRQTLAGAALCLPTLLAH